MDRDEILNEAVKALRGGNVILYPTDTVWGIGCDATDPEAVARVFQIKRRSDSKSLVLLAGDVDMIARYVREIPEIALQLIEVNDRPMTVVYPDAVVGAAPAGINAAAEKGVTPPPAGKMPYGLAANVVAEDGSVGIRIPLRGFSLDLVRRFGRPIVSTSANISGEATPRNFAEISEEIRRAVDYTVDPAFGLGSIGAASSIIKVGLDSTVKIIRK